jgi:hypothetical protein
MIPFRWYSGVHPVPVRKVVEKDWICQFRPTSLDLSLGLVENDTRRGVFFTKLTGRLLLEVAVNKTQAEQYRDFARSLGAWSDTPSHNHSPEQSHP